jgi:hypothetical protein
MKHKVLLAAVFLLLAALTAGTAWADGGCKHAKTAALATPATAVAATASLDLAGLGTAQPVWLTVNGTCCGDCQNAYDDCLASCPPVGSGGHVICVATCRSNYRYCTASCGGCP